MKHGNIVRIKLDTGGAEFSSCMTYRYKLWRELGEGDPIAFVMLNPSTADERVNDPTIERCERRARAWGYGQLRIANLFALRSTDPRALYSHPDPVGPHNDEALRWAAYRAAMVVCGWGQHGKLLRRGEIAKHLLSHVSCNAIRALKINRNGEPSHPLYLPYELTPVLF